MQVPKFGTTHLNFIFFIYSRKDNNHLKFTHTSVKADVRTRTVDIWILTSIRENVLTGDLLEFLYNIL